MQGLDDDDEQVCEPVGDANATETPDQITKQSVLQDCSKYRKIDKIELENREVYTFDDSEIRTTKAPVQYKLVGGVMGNQISIKRMKEFIAKNWIGMTVSIVARSNGIWSFSFCKEKDMKDILEHDVWLVEGKFPLALIKWKIGMKYSWSSFDRVPAWIRL